jgi:hypothetical protein
MDANAFFVLGYKEQCSFVVSVGLRVVISGVWWSALICTRFCFSYRMVILFLCMFLFTKKDSYTELC